MTRVSGFNLFWLQLQNMNDVTEGQMLQLTQEINRGKVDFDKDVQIIRDLIHEFLVSEKEPKEKMLSFIKVKLLSFEMKRRILASQQYEGCGCNHTKE